MSGTGFPSGAGLGDPAAWATPVQQGVPDTRQVPASLPVGDTAALRDVVAERLRQVSQEGWTVQHDDEHSHGELANAAAVYANPEVWNVFGATGIGWPWAPEWYKPTGRRRDLVKAAALLLAEIERMDRREHP